LEGSLNDRYGARTERLRTALAALGPKDQRLTPQQLSVVDQFHTLGLTATAQLAELAGGFWMSISANAL
jgi:sarcosine/dimethylglycine N-methyltransferase